MSEETYKKKVFFIFLLLCLLAVVSFIVIQYYNCFQRFIFIYINIYFIGKSLEIFYTKCKDRYKWNGMQVLILSSQCRFFATDRLLSLCRLYQCLAIKTSIRKYRRQNLRKNVL